MLEKVLSADVTTRLEKNKMIINRGIKLTWKRVWWTDNAAFYGSTGSRAGCPVRWKKATPCGAVEESTGLLSRIDRSRSRTPVLV